MFPFFTIYIAMDKMFQNWRKFLNEGKISEEQINEATDEEMGYLDDVLHNLNPQDLSFNNIFGDKMRIIHPMKTKDKMFDILKQVLHKSGYKPDFSTGLATYHTLNIGGVNSRGERNKPIILTPEQKKHMMDDDGVPTRFDTDTDEDFEKRKKLFQKKQIKIGKLLQKAARLYDGAHKAWNEKEELNPTDFGLSTDRSEPDDEANVERYRAAATEAKAKEKKELQKLFDVFQDYKSSASSTANIFKQLADWWNKKSAFYRENPDEAGEETSPYSIIYSRHPIDVMRMSDFDNIETCHSPPSRQSSQGDSYYKCAVAEAHGHGPIAYVVRNEDMSNLLYADVETQDTAKDLQGLLDLYEKEDKELFVDNMRNTGDIAPLSRVRIKKLTNPFAGISLAVPSTRVYGKRFPDLYQNIADFTKSKQEGELDAIKAAVEKIGDEENPIFNTDGFFDLSNWERHGGSYEDAGDYANDAIHQWLGYSVTGRSGFDSTTEDNLDVNNQLEEWQAEVERVREQYNRGYQAARITRASVEDDGAGEYYIEVEAVLRIVLSEGDFVLSAFQDKTRTAIDEIPSQLIEYGYDELMDQVHYSTLNPRSQDWADLIRQIDDEENNQIVMEIPIDIGNINGGGSSFAYSPDDFEGIAANIDTLDDKADAITEVAKGVLKREGILEGGALITLARSLEGDSWYEWNYDVDDEYDPTSIELETATYVNFEDLAQQLPITLDRPSPQSTEVYVLLGGEELALASQLHGGEDYSFKGWEVRSPRFESDKLSGFKDLDEVVDYARDQVTKMILRPWSQSRGGYGKIPKGIKSSRDYTTAVSVLMRDAAGGKEGEFSYPNREIWVNGPDSDDEYKIMFRMSLGSDDPDEVVDNAHTIIAETDDEDQLKEIFRTAFAQAAQIPAGKMQEVKQYFSKFDIF